MTRIAVIADIHGNLPALEAVAAHIEEQQVDQVVNLGDVASGPLWPKETVAYLIRRGWLTIAGNHDRQVASEDPASHGPTDQYAYSQLDAAQRAWLGGLAPTALVEPGIMLCHGTPTSDLTYLLETIEDGRFRLAQPAEISSRVGPIGRPILVCGHSHVPRVVAAPDGTVIVNPGSVGLQAFRDNHPVDYLSETGSPSARYAILELSANPLRVSLLAIDYDHESAAREAERNGNESWAKSLRTGYAWS